MEVRGGKTGIADFNLGSFTLQTGPDGKPVAPDSDYRKRTAGEGRASGEKAPKTAFYAVFKNLEDGAIGLLHRLATGPNGGPALLAALIYGSREEYVYVLKSYKYFSGPIRNIMIQDRDGAEAIWWSGYLDSMASVPEVAFRRPRRRCLREPSRRRARKPTPAAATRAASRATSRRPGRRRAARRRPRARAIPARAVRRRPARTEGAVQAAPLPGRETRAPKAPLRPRCFRRNPGAATRGQNPGSGNA